MANLILILFCFLAGIILRKTKILPETTPAVLNTFIIYISLPAMVLLHIRKLQFTSLLVIPALMPWAVFFVAAAVFFSLGKIFHWGKPVTGAIILAAGLGNTSFLGIPMIQAYYGNEGVPIGLLIDQAGSFLALSTIGLVCAAVFSGTRTTIKIVSRKIFTFPPLIAMILALLLIPVYMPPAVEALLQMLSATLAPLALVSVGYRWHLGKVILFKKELILGLGYKMIVAPVLTALILAGIGIPRDLLFNVTVFEAAMPPMITAAIVAAEYNLEPDLAAALVGTGIPISFVFLAIAHYLLQ